MNQLLTLVNKLAETANRIGSEVLLPLSGAVIVVFLIWGGIQYMSNPEAGKKTIIGAIIGAVIVVLSYWLFATLITALH